MSKIVEDSKEQAVEKLWASIESSIVESCSELNVATIVKEVLKRIKDEMGLDDAFVYFSQYSVFMIQFSQLLMKHINAVKEESHTGTLVIDGSTIEPIGEDASEEDVHATVSAVMFLTDGYRHSELFAEALKTSDFVEAQRIIDERAGIIEDGHLPQLVELDNWRVNLAIYRGDIDGFITFYKKAKTNLSGINLVHEKLGDMLKKLLGKSMISGLSVYPKARKVSQAEAQGVVDFFWDTFLESFANMLEQNVRTITESTFRCLVVTCVANVTDVMNENLDVITEVIWVAQE